MRSHIYRHLLRLLRVCYINMIYHCVSLIESVCIRISHLWRPRYSNQYLSFGHSTNRAKSFSTWSYGERLCSGRDSWRNDSFGILGQVSCPTNWYANTIVDTYLRTARVWKNFVSVHELKGHGQAVWAVLAVDDSQVLTGMAITIDRPIGEFTVALAVSRRLSRQDDKTLDCTQKHVYVQRSYRRRTRFGADTRHRVCIMFKR